MTEFLFEKHDELC